MTDILARPFTAFAFEQFLAEKKLMAARCTACGALTLPPRAICPHCRSEAMAWTETSGKGKLAAFTVIYIAPTFMIEQGYGRDKPYVSGIVELEEGPRVSAHILGLDPTRPEEIKIGTPLVVDFIEHSAGEKHHTYLAFRLP
jgi:hypothetical protein